MSQRLRRSKRVGQAIVREIRAENITFMAGSIAYHAFVSLLPFLLLVLFVLSQVGGPELAQRFIEAIAENLTPAGSTASGGFASLLVEAATNATRSRGLSFLSLAILVWGTLRIFRGLDQAFSDIYESHAANTFLDQILDAVVVFSAIGTALFLVTAAEQLVGLPTVGAADAVVRPVASALTLAIAFYPMYYVFPDEDVSLREVVPGSLVAGIGWTALSYGFGLYTSVSSTSEYGLVGVIILLITWLYFGGLVLLLGAAVNAVLAGRSEDVDNIAWGRAIDTDPTHNDAAFVVSLRELEVADWDGDVRIVVDDADVTVPAPNDATVTVRTVDRPWLLGGDKETAEVCLRWNDSERR